MIESGTEVKSGDELVRLDTLLIEEEISERAMYAHLAKSDLARSAADVAAAELAIPEYLQGRYVSQLAALEKDLAIAESTLRTAKDMLGHTKMMSESQYVSELEVEERTFAVEQADLDVKLKGTQIDVLKRFAMPEELATLNGNLAAEKATYEAVKERVYADEQRLARAQQEIEYCVIAAKSGGMAIYPTGEKWKEAREIEEGATVHQDQVLLLMPDLSKMQVKVGIHESVVDRINEGLPAKVTLPDQTLDGVVSSVSLVTAPTGWWTGNEVRYDTFVDLPSGHRLRPGMSAEVEVLVARHKDVLTIPVVAIVETEKGNFCWVKTAHGTRRRSLGLGDTNDVFTVVETGLKEGDEVVLNPTAFIEETQTNP
ncbi:MAG: hypothetical protein HQ567_13945 [Candidatus Nealsonbacteria bacterium]|nr:hypothetical protein [Candidatus Nealsonbacteria bacterium]